MDKNDSLGNHQLALADSNKAIELDPGNGRAYFSRRIAYDKLGDHRQAFNDYKTDAKWGYKPAQDYLRSKGMSW